MDILIQDLRFALRSLRRSGGFTVVVVAVLALGIGVNTMIFSMVYGCLFRPWPLPRFDRVVTVRETNKAQDIKGNGVSWLNYLELRDQAKSFSVMGGFWGISGQVIIGDEPEKLDAADITSGLLPALGVTPQLGRNFTRDEEVYGENWKSVLVSDRIWRRRLGGKPDVLGKTLKLNGRVRTIVGVMPPGFQWPETADFWIPTAVSPEDARARADHSLDIVARLASGVTKQQAEAEMQGLYARMARQNPVALKGWSARVNGFADEWRKDIVPLMLIVSFAVGFVLLIACANVANLMLARAAARKREISVRLALGASRARVARQLLTESLLLSLTAAGIGTALAVVGNRLWMGMIPLQLPFWLKFQIDLPVLAFTVAISTLAAVLFGVIPAAHASDTKLSEAIREGSVQAGSGRARGRARSALVVAEVALSLTLLVASGLMVRSLFAMLDSEKLVRSEGVLTAHFLLPIATWPSDTARREFCDRVLPLARALPGVQSASIITDLPLGRNSNTIRIVAESGTHTDPERPLRANVSECYPEFFSTLGMALRRGRDFTDADGPGAPAVAIVNESLAKTLWPGRDPLGMRLKPVSDDRKLGWRTVVGVVADVTQDLDDHDRVAQSLFVPHRQEPDQALTWVVHANGDPAAFAGVLRRMMRAQAPDVPLTEVRSMHDAIKFAVWTQRLFGSLMAVFAVLALVIAAVGLYGVMAYSVAQRTQEIGIRMALGAQTRDVVNLVVGQALRLTLIGTGIGFAAAYALTRGMTSVLFGVSSTDPPTYLGVVLILALSSVLAAWVPAHRATRVDPMRALRCD
ncbi:MAG TPA: ABC transporter permease [Candidatus Eisenbacteria bacterium]|jgi:putative ABC transport system permease protein